eukprot:764581-Hanusia_phi.AAC.11
MNKPHPNRTPNRDPNRTPTRTPNQTPNQGKPQQGTDPMLDVRWSNWMPEPIMCWACGHELGEKCHAGVRFGRACPHAEKGKKCNGYAFPGCPPRVEKQDRTPLRDYYTLASGTVMYVHHQGDDRILVPVDQPCGVCKGVHTT